MYIPTNTAWLLDFQNLDIFVYMVYLNSGFFISILGYFSGNYRISKKNYFFSLINLTRNRTSNGKLVFEKSAVEEPYKGAL